ncbi:hypothetical protein ET33_02250 [Paenibacillus tyrfis]|uniref:Uncharacterized protein n=1 Tax=Paenibacillus tyrfis TaxID=1501230 RepID=A0A081P4E1_9BACL|nr:hypothetical protein ET33_02250 [Paenibacillus tyrfis]
MASAMVRCEVGLDAPKLIHFLFSGPEIPVRCGRNESWIRKGVAMAALFVMGNITQKRHRGGNAA